MKYSQLFLAALLIAPFSAFADGDNDNPCTEQCPDGQVMVSYADGNSVSCHCAAESNMDPTVADPNIVEGQDGGVS